MNQTFFDPNRRYPVTLGPHTIYLQTCRMTGLCTVQEQAAANGLSAVTGITPKGLRLELRGFLPPSLSYEEAAVLLASYLREGTEQELRFGTLCCRAARLWGYTLSDEKQPVQLVLRFYVPTLPERMEDVT